MQSAVTKLNTSSESERMRPKTIKDLKSLFDKKVGQPETTTQQRAAELRRKRTSLASIFETNIKKQADEEEELKKKGFPTVKKNDDGFEKTKL